MTTHIPDNEIELRFVHAGGPGGQNVNKVATAVQLRWDLSQTRILDRDAMARLRRLAKNRISGEDILIIESRIHRTQARNRADAYARLEALLEQARKRPVPRKATKPSRAARTRRLDEKRRRGEIKRLRRNDF